MNLVKAYGNVIKKNFAKPETVLKLIILGIFYEYSRLTIFPNKKTPKSIQYLNRLGLKFILEPLKNPQKSAWVTLMAPSQILHAMDIYPLFIEAFSSFLSGMECETVFIDYAEKIGIAESLCSYHKAFLGAGEAGILPKPQFAVTTSLICDGNINTMKYLAKKYEIPYYALDIPYEYNKGSEEYVIGQLKELVAMIENATGKKLEEEKLKEVLKREQKSRIYQKKYLAQLKNKSFPTTLTSEMFMLFTAHVFMGRKETCKFYEMLVDEIKNYPESEKIKIFWVHLMPFYQHSLKEYFNNNPHYQLVGCDLYFDYADEIDYNNPYQTLARRMLLNRYNGCYQRRVKHISNLIENQNPDGVINFCHWGCKQSSGGVMLLKEEMKQKNIPFLILEGDGVDKRNGQDGQIRTRLEAFMEILEKNNSR
ncbi:MAG TPA: 2-hydroxyacyl-CoA dehydratase [Clostridia bacterium]|nr:2-hydroxyacyl-CoA dehydratase [Clostridia bacterium]